MDLGRWPSLPVDRSDRTRPGRHGVVGDEPGGYHLLGMRGTDGCLDRRDAAHTGTTARHAHALSRVLPRRVPAPRSGWIQGASARDRRRGAPPALSRLNEIWDSADSAGVGGALSWSG